MECKNLKEFISDAICEISNFSEMFKENLSNPTVNPQLTDDFLKKLNEARTILLKIERILK